MKIAVISDIHGNYEALKTVLRYLRTQNISRIICLGDVVGYGARPNECVEAVRENCEVCLMGNHDHAVLGKTDIYYFNEYAQKAVLWTRHTLESANMAFLENLPFTHESGDLLFVHSTPVEPGEWHYVFSENDARHNLDAVGQALVFIGHSHIPVIFSRNDGAFFAQKIRLDLKQDRYIVNVGSVGQPRDGDPRSCLVLYDPETRELEDVRLTYSAEITYQEILDSRLPQFLAMRLLAGQ